MYKIHILLYDIYFNIIWLYTLIIINYEIYYRVLGRNYWSHNLSTFLYKKQSLSLLFSNSKRCRLSINTSSYPVGSEGMIIAKPEWAPPNGQGLCWTGKWGIMFARDNASSIS